MRLRACLAAVLAAAMAGWLSAAEPEASSAERDVTQGALRIVAKDGGVVECPLKHTDVRADISGFIARVKVIQTFHNPLDERIEAVYVFPLPHKAAVDDMTMVVGERRILGLIRRRAEARSIYEQAISRGHAAALLEQERPNIFTQSVGNIPPKQEVKVEISYLDVLEYDLGVYEFHFPMVVGPRYIPGGPHSARVPDASRITPPALKPGERNGHDISLAVWLNAGVPIQNLVVVNHKAEVERDGAAKAAIALSRRDTIPNKDFVLRYAVAGPKPEIALLCHTREPGKGYFMLMVQPKEDERLKASPPREIVFLVDVSGSMSGQPTAKVREAMARLLRLCKPNDTLQLVVFANRASKLFEKPLPATEVNIRRAVSFAEGLEGSGGTEMLKGVKMAINEPLDPERLRIVIMLTDGYIGNEAEIIAEVGRSSGDKIRFWVIGIGSAPNRFLIDGVARQGGGMAKVLGLNDDPGPMAVEIMQRIQRAQLANISLDWGQATIHDTYPAKVPELWAGRPVVLFGRYDGAAGITLTLSGEVEGKPAKWTLPAAFPAEAPDHAVIAHVWARHKIEDLMQQTFYAGSPAVEEEVTQLALAYRLMSHYTSFVAVDEAAAGQLIEPARPPRRMLVPIPIPEGTLHEGFFGPEREEGLRLALGREVRDDATAAGLTRGNYSGRMPLPPMPMAPSSMPVTVEQERKAGDLANVPRFAWRQGGAGDGYTLRRAAQTSSLDVDAPAELVREADRLATSVGRLYGWRALGAHMGAHAEFATKRLAEAEELRKKGDLHGARARLAFAYLADSAAQAVRLSTGQTASKALNAIEEIDRQFLGEWAAGIPGLAKRLDLVLRDNSLDEALDAVARAAGISIKPIVGSVDDAAALLGGRDIRVSFLDLRRATAAEALNWLLTPNRLSWWVAKGTVVVASARRSGRESAWVYNVANIALPIAAEFDNTWDYAKRSEAVARAAERFLKTVQAELKLSDDSVLWYAPGQLLIFGSTQAHVAARDVLTLLASPHSRPAGALAELYKETAPRAREHQAGRAERHAIEAKARLIEALPAHGWALLAAAFGGSLDLEALTELQIAWRSPAMAELLESRSVAAARALWAIAEAARTLPREPELAELAALARARARLLAEASTAELAKSPADAAAFFRALYATLACRDDAPLAAKALPALSGSAVPAPPMLQVARILAPALLVPTSEVDRRALLEVLVRHGAALRGDDLVALTALACRRAGGEAWRVFRAEARELLGRQPLDGGVVVLINRLGRPTVQLASASSPLQGDSQVGEVSGQVVVGQLLATGG